MPSISEQQRIAILSPMGRHGGSAHGGITPVVLGIARGFREHGIAVDMLTPFAEGAGNKLDAWGLDVGLHSLAGGRWQRSRRLKQYLREHDCAGLICAGHRMNTLGCQFSASSLPVVTTVHNNMSQSLEGKSFLKSLGLRNQLKTWQKKSKAMVAVSNGVASDLQENFELEKVSVIHNGIDIDYLRKQSLEHVEYPWFEVGDEPVIVAVGRLTEQKDFSNLIHAFSILRKRQSAKLIILGEGDLRIALQTLIEDLNLGEDVALPGFVSNPFAYVAKANLFCLSSAWEGFGNVIVEAMAVGTPVVSTDCPSGPAEILQGGKFGTLVPIKDSSALADALESGLNSLQPAPEEAVAPFECKQVAKAYANCLGYEINA
ncbi:MAG: glycosyltransferase [Agarilytica sp.]